jgi:hypothetical protein
VNFDSSPKLRAPRNSRELPSKVANEPEVAYENLKKEIRVLRGALVENVGERERECVRKRDTKDKGKNLHRSSASSSDMKLRD